MKLSSLTTFGAAAALALALGFAGTPAFAQGMPDQPSAGAGPSGPEGAGGPAMSEPGGGGAGMPAPQDSEMGAGPDAGAPPAAKEAEKTLPSDEGPAAGKSGTKAEGAGKTGTDTEMKGAGKAGSETETKMEKGEKAAGAESKEGDKAGAELKGRSRTGAEVEGDTGKTGAAETEMKGGEGKAAVKIDSGQKTKITSYFRENKPDVKVVEKSSVSVSIGIVVPAAISLHPLPPDIIVVAGDCSLLYFLWGGDLVLVDSCSRHVVDIIPGIV